MSNSVSQNGKSLDQRLAGLDLSPSSAEERGEFKYKYWDGVPGSTRYHLLFLSTTE